MIEFYPQIRSVHIALALCSGLLFALRGGALLVGMRWPTHVAVRWTGHLVDTALLTAALMLLAILPAATFSNGWLVAKITLIVVYIALGMYAVRRTGTRGRRALAYVAALATFAFVYTIARAHHPLGILHALPG